MTEINQDDYDEVPVDDATTVPQVGDIVYHKGKVQLVIAENTDLIQEEFYPMLLNFGCVLLRKKRTA